MAELLSPFSKGKFKFKLGRCQKTTGNGGGCHQLWGCRTSVFKTFHLSVADPGFCPETLEGSNSLSEQHLLRIASEGPSFLGTTWQTVIERTAELTRQEINSLINSALGCRKEIRKEMKCLEKQEGEWQER